MYTITWGKATKSGRSFGDSVFRRRVTHELLIIDCDPAKRAMAYAWLRHGNAIFQNVWGCPRELAKHSFISGRCIGNIRRET